MENVPTKPLDLKAKWGEGVGIKGEGERGGLRQTQLSHRSSTQTQPAIFIIAAQSDCCKCQSKTQSS